MGAAGKGKVCRMRRAGRSARRAVDQPDRDGVDGLAPGDDPVSSRRLSTGNPLVCWFFGSMAHTMSCSGQDGASWNRGAEAVEGLVPGAGPANPGKVGREAGTSARGGEFPKHVAGASAELPFVPAIAQDGVERTQSRVDEALGRKTVVVPRREGCHPVGLMGRAFASQGTEERPM